MQQVPSNCILYCGLQDILNKSTSSDIFDRLGSLITELKKVNENMNIHICELAPIPSVLDFDEHINNFNNQLATWSADNGVSTIKTNLQYRLGTGDVDHMCFNPSETNECSRNFLKRHGIIRLLSIISKQCPSLELNENWENIMSQRLPIPSHSGTLITQTSKNPPKQMDYRARILSENQRSYPRERRIPRPHYQRFNSQDSQDEARFSRRDNSFTHQNHFSNSRGEGQGYNHNNTWRRNQYAERHQYPSSQGPPGATWHPDQQEDYIWQQDGQSRYHPHPRNAKLPQNHSRRSPCHNCGEVNHDLRECRYSYRVQCRRCKRYGHKEQLCRSDI